MTATITALAEKASMREITIGLDGVRLPSDGANLVEFVEAIATADPGLALMRWVDTRFAGTDLLAIHTQVVHMESLADEPQAADGAPGHGEWLDRWACAELELRDLLATSVGGAA